MEDAAIIQLYWERSEQAISETDTKYGGLCRYVAGNILQSPAHIRLFPAFDMVPCIIIFLAMQSSFHFRFLS